MSIEQLILTPETREKEDRHSLCVAVHILLFKENKVLLGRRYNTGYLDGYYGPPAGHLEDNESALQALQRECLEEIGINLYNSEIQMLHTLHLKSSPKNYVYLFFSAKDWQGIPSIREPDKCDSLSWYDLEHLPENIMPVMKVALNNIQRGIQFSEQGWDFN